MKRFFPNKEFPPYAFVPGKHPHPEKPGGHMHDEEINCPPLEDHKENMAYLYAIDLYNHGYYWESHVWWEYLWHLAGRKGNTADFLKALIKLAAANLKRKMSDQSSYEMHLQRAQELIHKLSSHKHEFYGVNLSELLKDFSYIDLKK